MARQQRKPEIEACEAWREYRRQQQRRRSCRLPERQSEIRSLRRKGYDVCEMNDGYQFRIDRALDLYPIHRRYHHLPTGKRGDYVNVVAVAVRFLKKRGDMDTRDSVIEERAEDTTGDAPTQRESEPTQPSAQGDDHGESAGPVQDNDGK